MARYAVSDLHGDMSLFSQIIDFIKSDDIVYCLGDNNDRGKDGWPIIKAMLADKRFIYLKGNHEDMLARAMLDWAKGDIYSKAINILYYNGGSDTLQSWITDGANLGWYSKLKRLPLLTTYTNLSGINIIMSHAGFTPGDVKPTDDDLLWDREHFLDKWPQNAEQTIILHGHTPISYLVKEINQANKLCGKKEETWVCGAFYYADNHKIDIDCGCFATQQTVLLNLDTFDEHIFN